MTRRVLVPMDDTPPSEAALEHALSAYPAARLIVLHVIEPARVAPFGEAMAPTVADGAALERAGELFEAVERRAAAAEADLSTVTERGSPARTIVEFAASGVDHIVIGTHGRAGVGRFLLGSVAEEVARRATVPVTVVQHRPVEDSDEMVR